MMKRTMRKAGREQRAQMMLAERQSGNAKQRRVMARRAMP
jgi:hypothetical protein